MRKIKYGLKVKYWVSIVFIIIISMSYNSYAASIDGSSEVYIGDTFSVTFYFGKNVGAYDSLKVEYNQDILEYVSGNSLTENVWWDQSNEQNGIGTKTYTFRAKAQGQTRIGITVEGAYLSNETMDPLNPGTQNEALSVSAEKFINVLQKQEEPPKPQEEPPAPSSDPIVAPPTNPTIASANNYLKYLQISEEGITPNFSKNITEYAISVGENISSLEILARAEDSNAKVQISGHENIVDGDNIITIKVTAQNGYYRVYTITVTKSVNKETSNAYLDNIIVEGYELNRPFQSETLEYSLGEISSTVKSFNIIAQAKDANAQIEIIGDKDLSNNKNNQVIIKVTAADGVNTKEYKINYKIKEESQEKVYASQMKDYLKDVKDSTSFKQKAISLAKYIWTAIKKNYLLALMYVLVLLEFITIVVLNRKNKKSQRNIEGEDTNYEPPKDKTILEVDKENKKSNDIVIGEQEELVPPKVELLEDNKEIESIKLDEKLNNEQLGITRSGSRQNKADSNDIPQLDINSNDEITFNIFENLNDDDIKRVLDDTKD